MLIWNSRRTATTLLTLSIFLIRAVSAQPLMPVENGQAKSVIVLSTGAAEDEELAARELQEYVRRISTSQLEIRHVAPAEVAQTARELNQRKQFPILLGQAATTPPLEKSIRDKGTDPASFALKVGDDGVRIVGLSAQGTLFGVYELLEQLGVRWFIPGEFGTVVPESKTLSLREQETIQVPSFNARWQNSGRNYPEWGRHLRMGGPFFPPAHGIHSVTIKEDFAPHPEYFALVNGKRQTSQLCVSNADVVSRTIAYTKAYFRKNPDALWIGLGPEDRNGFCECEHCRALDGGDWDPFSNQVSVTDRYIWFYNQVLEGIKDEFPDKKIAFYAYHAYMRPPIKAKPNLNIVPALAPIALCRVHGMDNPLCPERSYYKTLLTGWGKVLPQVYDRGYWFNLADPGFPFSMVHKMRDEMPAEYDLGVKGWRVETNDQWASETPSLYVASKLMWNHKTDVDALLSDFYEKFFGPAREPMRAYFTMMDAALRDADYHTGSSFDLPHIYTPLLRNKARQRLNEATKQSGTGIYAERVKLFHTSFDYLETFLAMQEHRNSFDFTAAEKDLKRLDTYQKTLMAYNPPMLSQSRAVAYLTRFFRQPITQGFARTTDGNKLVASLNDEWQFQLDPQKVGEDIGLWKSEARGNNWQRLKTSTLSWGDQGLRTYKGEAWYRQEVEIPQRFKGQRIFLWFGGVDEKAKVWLNGQLIGISHGSAFVPFELDATPAIRFGARNVVSVRLVNEEVNELGTGGITAPVMFYAPVAGKDAKLENIRDLKPTFP